MNPETYAGRRERLARLASTRQLDGVLVFSWQRSAVGWFTGYWPGFLSNWATLFVAADGGSTLGVRFGFDRARAKAVSELVPVQIDRPDELVPEGTRRVGLVGRDLGIDETPLLLVSGLAEREVEVVDLADEVIEWRATKAQGEIEAIRAATEVASASLRTLAPPAPGMTDFEIAGRVEGEARRLGAFRALCLVGIGDGRIVTEPTGVSVADGDAVGIELTLQAGPSWTHVNWTLLPKDPAAHQRHAIDVCRTARQSIVANLRPGTAAAVAVQAGDHVLAEHGLLDSREYDYGHGIGAHTPEIPRLVDGSADRVAEGHVIAVHVSVRTPNGPTAFVGGPVVIGPGGAVELLPAGPWAA